MKVHIDMKHIVITIGVFILSVMFAACDNDRQDEPTPVEPVVPVDTAQTDTTHPGAPYFPRALSFDSLSMIGDAAIHFAGGSYEPVDYDEACNRSGRVFETDTVYITDGAATVPFVGAPANLVYIGTNENFRSEYGLDLFDYKSVGTRKGIIVPRPGNFYPSGSSMMFYALNGGAYFATPENPFAHCDFWIDKKGVTVAHGLVSDSGNSDRAASRGAAVDSLDMKPIILYFFRGHDPNYVTGSTGSEGWIVFNTDWWVEAGWPAPEW